MATGEPGSERRQRMRPAAIIAAAVVVTLLSALMAGLGVLYFGGDPASTGQGAVPLPGAATTAATSNQPSATSIQPSAAATQAPATSAQPSESSAPPAPSPTRQAPPVGSPTFRFQPLWPFASVAEAAEWQRSYREGGGQPWHLDVEQTALSFTTGFLGFTEIDRVVARSIKGADARISVGYASGEGPASVAAVIHLVRIGQGPDAPWEVVGTTDSTLTLERPRYGAQVSSPITVGGRITGVDESIRIDVRQAGSEQLLGSSCCVPGGGERQPWSTRVSFRGAADGAVTIVASTGGHVQDVERFAITGVRVG